MGRQSVIRDFIALLGATVLLASQASLSKLGGSGRPAQRTGQRLAYADAIVTGSGGRPVPDLGPSDFSISVGGSGASVMSAEYFSSGDPVPDDARRVVVLYDTCAIPLADEFIEGLAASGLAQTGILAVLPSLEGPGVALRPGGSLPEPTGLDYQRTHIGGSGMCDGSFDRDAVVGKPGEERPPGGSDVPTYDGISSALDGLASVPGRKNLVVISAFLGWNTLGVRSPRIQRLVDLANRAGVAIHVLDPARAFPFNGKIGEADPITKRMTGHLAAVQQLTASTGGLFIMDEHHYTNRDRYEAFRPLLKKGLTAIAAYSAAYYRLGYVSNEPRDGGEIPKLEVKVTTREGLKVRSWANAVPPPIAAAPGREERLHAALRSPFVGHEIGVRVFPDISAGEPDRAAPGIPTNLRADISVDARDLVFLDEPGGSKRASVDVIAAAYGPEHVPAAVKTGSCSMNMNLGAQPPSAQVMLCALDLGVVKPGGYMLRVAVADQAGVKVGSAYAFAPALDFNTGWPQLTPVVLEQPFDPPDIQVGFGISADVSPRPAASAPPRANRVDRVFAPGATVAYSFEAYGFRLRKGAEGTGMAVRLQIGRRGAQRTWNIDGKAAPAGKDPALPILVRGTFTIPADAEPGRYWLICVLADAIMGGRPRQTDFTVAAPAQTRR